MNFNTWYHLGRRKSEENQMLFALDQIVRSNEYHCFLWTSKIKNAHVFEDKQILIEAIDYWLNKERKYEFTIITMQRSKQDFSEQLITDQRIITI